MCNLVSHGSGVARPQHPREGCPGRGEHSRSSPSACCTRLPSGHTSITAPCSGHRLVSPSQPVTRSASPVIADHRMSTPRDVARRTPGHRTSPHRQLRTSPGELRTHHLGEVDLTFLAAEDGLWPPVWLVAWFASQYTQDEPHVDRCQRNRHVDLAPSAPSVTLERWIRRRLPLPVRSTRSCYC